MLKKGLCNAHLVTGVVAVEKLGTPEQNLEEAGFAELRRDGDVSMLLQSYE